MSAPSPSPLPAGLPARSRFGEGRGEGCLPAGRQGVRGVCIILLTFVIWISFELWALKFDIATGDEWLESIWPELENIEGKNGQGFL